MVEDQTSTIGVAACDFQHSLSGGCATSGRVGPARNDQGVFFTERGKTGVPVGIALSDRALAALQVYIAHLGVDLHGEAFIFRNRSGAPYTSDTLGNDFRDIRHTEFGGYESRTLADFRRSGAAEAIAGDASMSLCPRKLPRQSPTAAAVSGHNRTHALQQIARFQRPHLQTDSAEWGCGPPEFILSVDQHAV
jgi:hypothetical protein